MRRYRFPSNNTINLEQAELSLSRRNFYRELFWRNRAKAIIYARSGVAEYWIVIPELSVIEIYTDPSNQGYHNVTQVSTEDFVAKPNVVAVDPIELSELFG